MEDKVSCITTEIKPVLLYKCRKYRLYVSCWIKNKTMFFTVFLRTSTQFRLHANFQAFDGSYADNKMAHGE